MFPDSHLRMGDEENFHTHLDSYTPNEFQNDKVFTISLRMGEWVSDEVDGIPLNTRSLYEYMCTIEFFSVSTNQVRRTVLLIHSYALHRSCAILRFSHSIFNGIFVIPWVCECGSSFIAFAAFLLRSWLLHLGIPEWYLEASLDAS